MAMKTVARYSPITFPVTKDGRHACLAYEDKDENNDDDENVLAKPIALEYESYLLYSHYLCCTYLHAHILNCEKKSSKLNSSLLLASSIKKYLTIKTCILKAVKKDLVANYI